jgi:hypothetical protein
MILVLNILIVQFKFQAIGKVEGAIFYEVKKYMVIYFFKSPLLTQSSLTLLFSFTLTLNFHRFILLVYPNFYKPYVILSESQPLTLALNELGKNAVNFYEHLQKEQWNYSYAPGKWTIKDILGHIIDTERVMSFRALCFGRRDLAKLPGFEQNDYARNGNYKERDPKDLIQEFHLLRQSNIIMFKGFSPEDLEQTGIASNGEFSVKALGYIIAGHEVYHQKIIENRYL